MLKNNLLADNIVKEIQLLDDISSESKEYMVCKLEKDLDLNDEFAEKKIITEKDVDIKFAEFLNNCHRCQTVEQKILIKKAYLLAKDAHKGAKRNSGDAFINHPVEVARIVTEDIGLGVTSAVCSILHDVVTNSEYTIEDIEHFFGSKITSIVDNLTKIKGTSQYFTTDQSEVYRKLLIGISEDIRIIFIKLADRLHNMRTLESLSFDRQKQVAYETRYIYAPLAERLGLFKIKSELEDLAFKYLNPEEYNVIAQQIEKNSRKEQIFINRFSLPIIAGLLKKGTKFEIKSRLKSIYSIFKKIQNKKVSFDEVYDILAIRIIFEPKNQQDEIEECLEIYKFITSIYQEKHSRTRNWLGEGKKSNGYEALHMTVRGANNRWIEVQIRSKNMDDAAEMGFAAHWKYKGIEDKKVEFDSKITELKEKLEQIDYNDFDYLENFKLLFTTEIVIYTPKGKEVMMPVGSTALDFAFYIHTQVGSNAIAAKINRKLTGLEHILQSGDTVEIITSEKSNPKSEWLDLVKTEKAKLAIKELLNINLITEQEKGVQILTKLLEKYEVVSNSQLIKELEKEFLAKNKYDLYFLIGTDQIKRPSLEDFINRKTKNRFIKYWRPQMARKFFNKSSNSVTGIDENLSSSSYVISDCCLPIPGDEVTGLLDKKSTQILIHKTNCKKLYLKKKDSDLKEVPIIWKSYKALSFCTKIEIEGSDELGIINKITSLLSNDLQINFRALHINADGILFNGWMEVYVHNCNHIEELLKKLRKIEGILKVETVADL
jgi:GTP pyrophosphokinase